MALKVKTYNNVQANVTFSKASSRVEINPTAGEAATENIALTLGKISKWYDSLVPTGGSSGKFLGWNSSGTAKWVDAPTSEDKNMSQTLKTDNVNRPLLMSIESTSNTTATVTTTGARNNSMYGNVSTGLIFCRGREISNVTVKTGSTAQSHITLNTLMTWLITSKQYIPSGKYCHVVLTTAWDYANSDILQASINGTNYEIQLAGVIIEFMGSATSYNAGTFRLLIHSSPTTSFTAATGYTKFPTATIAEYTCNGSSYSPVWKMILNAHPTITVSTDTTSATPLSHGGTFTAITSVTRDSNGHTTKVNTATYTLPSDNNTTYTFATGDAVGQFKVKASTASSYTNYNVNGISAGTDSGTANLLAYYSTATKISSTPKIAYHEVNSTASTPVQRNILHLFGEGVGNDAPKLISGTVGIIGYGDGGPQINFNTASSDTVTGGQNGAIIFTDHDSAAAGVSWHFVSDQTDWNVISKRFHAKTSISIGTDKPPSTTYTFYVTGSSYYTGDIVIGTSGSSSNDTGDIVWKYGNGNEKARIWFDDTYTAKQGPRFRLYKSDGTSLYSGYLPLADGTSASGTWGISITGTAASANKLNTNAGNTSRPVYFSGGIPIICDTPVSGKWWNGVPYVGNNGVLEIGKYIDFHGSNTSTNDYDYRITAETQTIYFAPKSSGDATYNLIRMQSPDYNQIQFQTTKTDKAYTSTGIVVYPLTTSGQTMLIQSDGNTVIGGGESPRTLYSNSYDSMDTVENETLYLASDSNEIHLITNLQAYSGRKVLKISDGQLVKSGGLWIAARDNAPVYANKPNAQDGGYYPAWFAKSKSGGWSMGVLSTQDNLYITYTTDADYSASPQQNQNTYQIQFQNKSGTVALTSDIPTIPTVNNASLTLKGAGTTVTTFTANASTNQSLDIVAGTNVTITPDATNHKITIASSYTNTDTKVTQTAVGSTYTNYRPLVISASNADSAPPTATTVTDGTFITSSIYCQPSSGSVYATKFIGPLQGNADTATKWKTARTLTIGSTGKSVDGSGNVSWSLSEIGAASSSHTHDSLYAVASSGSVPSTTLSAGQFKVFYNVNAGLANNMPASNNANFIIQLNKHSGNYDSQLGFSSNGNIYYRNFNAETIGSQSWRTILDSGNLEAEAKHLDSYSAPVYTSMPINPIAYPLSGFHRSNKLAFVPAANITIEYSTDGGSTWVNYGASNDVKRDLFINKRGSSVNIGPSSGDRTASMMTRVIVESDGRDAVLDRFLIQLDSGYHNVAVDIYVAHVDSPTTYTKAATGNGTGTWAYEYEINLKHNAGVYYRFSNSYYKKIAFYFRYTSVKDANKSSSSAFSGIMGFTGSYWGGDCKSHLANLDHLYTWDRDQNATFPANVTATKFTGPLNVSRVTKDSKAFPGANKAIIEEYVGGSTYNLPSSQYYHIISIQGPDTKYGTQLALGMTTLGAYYRNYNNQTWSDWKSIINSNTTYGISGAYGANNNTWVTTITAGGSGTTSTVPTSSTSAYGITKLYNGVDSTNTGLAATANAVKTAYDKGNHSHPYLPDTTKYAGSSSAGGAATSANKLNTNDGGTYLPVYFSNGVPVAVTVKNNTSVGTIGWSSGAAANAALVTTNSIAYWNGAYTSTSSNLRYCRYGEIAPWLGNLTTIGSGSPASADSSGGIGAKAFWESANCPTGAMVSLAYNNSGDEYSFIFSKSGDGNPNSYGTVLRWGYPDLYIRILRHWRTEWRADDWEKIYAGYADSAGAVAWSGVSSKPTTLSGYGITDAKISSGTITLGSNTITPLTSHQSVSDKNVTLAWGTQKTIATIGSTDIHVTLPSNPNTNTTYTLGTSGDTVTLTPSSGSVQSITVPYATKAQYPMVTASNELRLYNDNQFKANNHFWIGYAWAPGSHYTPTGGTDTASTKAPNITKYFMGNCSEGGLASVHAKTFILGNGSSPTSSSTSTTIDTAATTTRTITLPDASGTVSLEGHTHNYAASATAGGAANSANKLNANAGSSTNPVYFTGGIPTACAYPTSGAYASAVPYLTDEGRLDIGYCIDFHEITSHNNYDYRLYTSTTGLTTLCMGSYNCMTLLSQSYCQIRFQTTASGKSTTAAGIVAYPLTTSGMTALFNFGGNLVIGGGESASTLYTNNYDNLATVENETLYLASDSTEIHFLTNSGSKVAKMKSGYFLDGDITWGGKDWAQSAGPIDAGLNSVLGANRFELAAAAGITIERSENSGSSWTTVSVPDTNKRQLFSVLGNYIKLTETDTRGMGTNAAKYLLRITLDASTASIYSVIAKFMINVSTSGSEVNNGGTYESGFYVKIYSRTANNVSSGTNTWKVWNKTSKTWVATDHSSATEANIRTLISGWSGWNTINLESGSGAITFGGSGEQIRQLRFVFGCDRNGYASDSSHPVSTYGGGGIYCIAGFGGFGWTTPSNLARIGHMYTWDGSQNVTFPAGIFGKIGTKLENGVYGTDYGILFTDVTTTSTNTAADIYRNGNFKVKFRPGTTSVEGWTEIFLGNTTASTANGNSTGWIGFYNKSGNICEVAAADGNNSVYQYFPNVSGTLLNNATGLPLAGGSMTGTINTPVNEVAFDFRNYDNWHTCVSYQTGGDEAFVFAAQNARTSIMFVSSENSIANHTNTRWQSLTPALQIKNNCVSIGKLIPQGTTPTIPLEVASKIVISTATSGSPELQFVRGTTADNYYDWRFRDSGGDFYFDVCTGSNTWTSRAWFPYGSDNFTILGSMSLKNGSYTATVQPSTMTANRTLVLPDKSGGLPVSNILYENSTGTQAPVVAEAKGYKYFIVTVYHGTLGEQTAMITPNQTITDHCYFSWTHIDDSQAASLRVAGAHIKVEPASSTNSITFTVYISDRHILAPGNSSTISSAATSGTPVIRKIIGFM